MKTKRVTHTKRRIPLVRAWLLAIIAAMTLMVGGVSVAYGATGDTPTHTKTIADNQDGTYTISLDIVGESEKKPNNVNVIVIVDTSGSMNTTRMSAAKNAVNNLANALYAYNTAENPDTVEMALVRFSTTESIAQDPTSSATTFRSAVNSLPTRGEGGTNWEGALQIANTVDFDDEDQTFVIFVSDGNPTFRYTEGNYPNHNNDYNWEYYRDYGVWGSGSDSGYGSGTTIARCYEHAVDDAQTLATKVTPANFFTIGAFGNVDRMEQLTDDAGSDSSTNYYSAQDTAALNQAIADILAKIEVAGFADAEIDDGTTSQVTTTSGEVANLLVVDESSYKYYRSGGSYGSMQQWTDAPAAHLVDGTVEWDLSSVGVLENGVKYTVTFDCYPSQTTYDIIAQLKNGDMTWAEVVAEGLDRYIVDNGGGSYSLRTNTNAGIAWDDTRDDEGRQTSAYTNPDPVATESSSLTATKEWEGDNPDVDSLEITVLMGDEPFHSATISKDNGWSTSSYISPGIIKNGQVLTGAEGHDFKFAELGSEQYRWEIESPVVHPMLINGTLTMLIMVDEAHPKPSGADTYEIDGKTYYVDTDAAGLTAVNHRRSNLNLTKIVTGEDAPADARFPFQLTVDNSKAPGTAPSDADDPEHETDYWIWLSVRDENGQGVTGLNMGSGVVEDGNGYYYAPSGTTFSLEIGAGWSLRFLNLPTDTTYTFVEGTLPEGFAFNKAELTQGEDSTFSGNQTTKGTIENTKTSYSVAYTNDYALTNLEITKVWDDNDDQDGLRLSAEELAAKLTLSPAVQGKTPTVTDNGDGTYTITYTGLPRFNNGQEVTYTVAESEIDGYTTEGSPAQDHGTITNTHEPEVTEVTVVKAWEDSDNIGGIRPTSIQAQLTAGGTASGDPVTLDENNSWTYTWENLPKYANGTEIVYSADETAVPAGYTKTGPEKSTADDGTITFTVTNTYSPTPVSVDPPVQKIIENNDDLYNGGDFTFVIANTAAPTGVTAPMPTNTSITNSATYELDNKPGFYEFGEITFTAPGTYKYTVSESGSVPGVTNDSQSTKEITFTVTDDGTGKLTVTPTTDQVELSFTNVYDATGSVQLQATKALAGAGWPEGKTLTFTLAGQGGTMPTTLTQTLTSEGTVTFDAITYGLEDAGKTYTYTITENGFGDGWTSDPADGVVTVSVEVVDNGNGTLTATPTYTPENGVVTNTYNASGSVTLQAIKQLDGRDWQEGESFTFTLTDSNGNKLDEKSATADGPVTFGAINYTLEDMGGQTEKQFTYTITETGNTSANVTSSDPITATVTVTDDGEGNLNTSVEYNNEDVIINTYVPDPVKAVINVTKNITGYAGAPDTTFNFTLAASEPADAPLPSPATASITTVNHTGTTSFGEIEYTEPGTYKYTVTETAGSANGWTYDTTAYEVVVTVKDNPATGKLEAEIAYGSDVEATTVTVVNEYNITGVDVILTANKQITDQSGSAEDATFTFQLLDASGSLVEEKSVTTSGLTGSVSFSALAFDTPGTYNYTIVETGTAPSGWTYDTTEHAVKIVVGEDLEAAVLTETTTIDGASTTEVTFTNIYKAEETTATLEVTKAIEDTSGSAPDIEFEFTLATTDGSPMPANTVVSRMGAGVVSFDPITYTTAGTFNYTITESQGTEAGWTYDTASYPVVVTVEDVDAKLVATTEYGESKATELTITNTYDPKDATATPQARKVIDDQSNSAPDEIFTFNLIDPDGKVIETKTRENGGYVEFSELTFDHVGTYVYQIQEVEGSTPGFTYDTAAHDVTIEVKDNGNAELVATITYADATDGELVITNEYKAEPTELELEVNKEVTGDVTPATDETFTFILAGEGQNLTTTVTGSGTATFDAIEFDKAGTYTYTVSEVKGSATGYTYDTSVYTVKVEVVDEAAQLVANVTISKDGEGVEVIMFENPYEPLPTTAKLQGLKVLEGKSLTEGMFTFELKDADGKVVATVTNAADGTIDFGTYDFTKAGTFTYTATEVKGSDANMTYDTATKTFTVTVVDNGGQLQATVDCDGNPVATFKNTYTEQTTPPTTPATGDSNGLLIGGLATLALVGGATGLLAVRRRKEFAKLNQRRH